MGWVALLLLVGKAKQACCGVRRKFRNDDGGGIDLGLFWVWRICFIQLIFLNRTSVVVNPFIYGNFNQSEHSLPHLNNKKNQP